MCGCLHTKRRALMQCSTCETSSPSSSSSAPPPAITATAAAAAADAVALMDMYNASQRQLELYQVI
jgi:hypothetical protein